jgi:hypothetical protein
MTTKIAERFPTARSAPAGPRHDRHEVLLRRAGIVILTALVLLGLLGHLGPSSRTAVRSSAAGTMEVTYDAVARPGVDSEVRLTVRPEPATDALVLTIGREILEVYGIDHFSPEPVEQRAEDGRLVLEFATGDGDTFDLRISGRTPTTQPPGRTTWRLEWLTDGSSAATLDATTWVLP